MNGMELDKNEKKDLKARHCKNAFTNCSIHTFSSFFFSSVAVVPFSVLLFLLCSAGFAALCPLFDGISYIVAATITIIYVLSMRVNTRACVVCDVQLSRCNCTTCCTTYIPLTHVAHQSRIKMTTAIGLFCLFLVETVRTWNNTHSATLAPCPVQIHRISFPECENMLLFSI